MPFSITCCLPATILPIARSATDSSAWSERWTHCMRCAIRAWTNTSGQASSIRARSAPNRRNVCTPRRKRCARPNITASCRKRPSRPRPRPAFPLNPEENLLYFIEKHAPKLEPWQRELARIVRKIAQYFYPQRQTQVMNEGWATFWHHRLINDMYDAGQIDQGILLECLHSHTNVVRQRDYSALNPYALGFAAWNEIKRVCDKPTAEDREYLPDIAGKDWLETFHDIDAELSRRKLPAAIPDAQTGARLQADEHSTRRRGSITGQ